MKASYLMWGGPHDGGRVLLPSPPPEFYYLTAAVSMPPRVKRNQNPSELPPRRRHVYRLRTFLSTYYYEYEGVQ